MAKQNMQQRRTILTSLGAMAAAGALHARRAEAQSAPSESFTPTLHTQDEWMSAMKGQHRVVLDVTSPTGVPDAIRFAGNLLTGHKNGWGVEESDVAVLVCFRHGATPFGYTDAVWSKYGSYASGPSYVDGMVPSLWIGAAVVLAGAVAAFAIGKRRVRPAEELVDAEGLLEAA